MYYYFLCDFFFSLVTSFPKGCLLIVPPLGDFTNRKTSQFTFVVSWDNRKGPGQDLVWCSWNTAGYLSVFCRETDKRKFKKSHALKENLHLIFIKAGLEQCIKWKPLLSFLVVLKLSNHKEKWIELCRGFFTSFTLTLACQTEESSWTQNKAIRNLSTASGRELCSDSESSKALLALLLFSALSLC